MSKGTPTTPFRIPSDLKAAALRTAQARGETLTSIVIAALRAYVAEFGVEDE
jgi:hypothetical protein